MWFSGKAAVGNAFAKLNPVVAWAADPKNAEAIVNLVDSHSSSGGKFRPLSPAERRALNVALRHSPLSPRALRLLALDSDVAGRTLPARRMFGTAHRLSRRDLITEAWLITDGARRGDLIGTISHYDAALSTNSEASVLLFPLLAKAIAYPQIVPALSPYLRQGRPWADGFVIYATENATDVDQVGALLAAARPLPPALTKAPVREQVLMKYVAQNNVTGAQRFALEVMGATQSQFESFAPSQPTSDARLAPLTWHAPKESPFAVDIDGKGAIAFLAPAHSRGIFLSRTMPLAVGAYQLSFAYEFPDGGDGITLAVRATCLSKVTSEPYWVSEFVGSPTKELQRAAFSVPASCPATRFDIDHIGDDQAADINVVVKNLHLQRVSSQV